MIVVTGATGKLGRMIVEELLRRMPAEGIGVSVRDPDRATDLVARGVRVRVGDYDDPASLDHAFQGADRVLLVSSNAAAHGGDPLAQHRRAIDAAVRAGAARILYTSHVAASPLSRFPPARDHAATEAMLADCGTAWTALRHGFYAEAAPMMMGDWRRTGVVRTPADGPVAWTAHVDLATADAVLLAGDAPDGPTAPLTGAEAFDMAALARLAGATTGEPVRRDVVPQPEETEWTASRGLPGGAARVVLGFYEAARAGEFATIDATLERTIGRPPRGIASVFEGLR